MIDFDSQFLPYGFTRRSSPASTTTTTRLAIPSLWIQGWPDPSEDVRRVCSQFLPYGFLLRSVSRIWWYTSQFLPYGFNADLSDSYERGGSRNSFLMDSLTTPAPEKPAYNPSRNSFLMDSYGLRMRLAEEELSQFLPYGFKQRYGDTPYAKNYSQFLPYGFR